jgi:hypothetical protein
VDWFTIVDSKGGKDLACLMTTGGDSASGFCTYSDVNDMDGAQGFQSLGAGHRHSGGFELLLQRASQQEGQGRDENVRPHPIGPVRIRRQCCRCARHSR